MKFKSFCFVLTTIFTLAASVAWAQPDGPIQVKSPEQEELTVGTIAELYDLVARAKADPSLRLSPEWIQKEYNRLVREMDATYHPAPAPAQRAPQPDKAVSETLPSEYAWTAEEGQS